MGKAILIGVAVVLVIYAFFDALATPAAQIKILPKPLWIAVIVLLPVLGALVWIVAGTARLRPGPGRGHGPRPPRGPDDDPDYLRGL